jgi:hypothetical protein
VTRWVEGSTAFEAVERTSAVRKLGIAKFDERAIQPGEPMYLLNMRFTHLYLHHRYSLEGLVKTLGGMDFRYAMRGDGQAPTTVVPAADQRKALTMVMDALEPENLAVPPRVQAMIPPVPAGGDPSMAWAPSAAGTAFDEVTLAGGLVTEVIEGLLQRERLARVVLFRSRGATDLTLDEVYRTIIDRTWGAAPSTDFQTQTLRRVAQRVVLNTMLDRAGDKQAMPDVRAVTESHLRRLAEQLQGMSGGLYPDQALRMQAMREILQYFQGDDDPASRTRFPVLPLPWP